jgi:hypothetical protein
MILGIVIISVVYLLFLLIIWSCCKVASDADKQSEEIYKAMNKKIEWQKPELIELAKAVSVGQDQLAGCIPDICTKGNSARYLCQKGAENK